MNMLALFVFMSQQSATATCDQSNVIYHKSQVAMCFAITGLIARLDHKSHVIVCFDLRDLSQVMILNPEKD